MASIDTLLDFVMPKAPGLTVELARLELRQAAIQFCRRSKADRRTLDLFDTVVGEPFYDLDAPSSAVAIADVLSVTLDGERPPLSPLRADEIPAEAQSRQDKPEWFSAAEGGTVLQLIYVPQAVYAVAVTVAVEPVAGSTNLETWVARRYGNDIAFGALAELLATPKKPWTDPVMATYYKVRFDTAILDAAAEADQGFTPAPTRTRPVFGLR